MQRNLLESIGAHSTALEQAAKAVLRESLDSISVHPCDEGDDAVAARQLSKEMKALLLALTGFDPYRS